MTDVIIIGSGPAGVSAALYTARAGLSTLVFGGRPSALEKAVSIENYYGVAPMSGPGLYETGLRQLAAVGAEWRREEVVGLGFGDGVPPCFTVESAPASGPARYAARAVILAAGNARKSPDLPGLAALEGHGVSYCAVCDGFFFRGKRVGVLGGGAYAAHEAAYLAGLTGDVTLFTDGQPLTAPLPDGVRLEERPLQALMGEEKLTGVRLQDGSLAELEGLFIALGSASAADFAVKLGILSEKGRIAVDDDQQTNVPGVFAAGDCTAAIKQVAVAAGQGAVAGLAAIRYVRQMKKA